MMQTTTHSQRGSAMIEALVAVLLFMLGVVGLVGAMGQVVGNQADVQFRGEATKHASEMMNTIWLNVDRTTPATTVASLQGFTHRPVTADANQPCNFGGADSGNALVTAWVDQITNGTGAARMPGSTPAMQQIAFDPATNNQVTITLCWQSSGDVVPRRYVLRSFIN